MANATKWEVVPGLHCAFIAYQDASSPIRLGATELAFKQNKSGAKRGEHPTWYDFTTDEKRVMRMIAAVPALVQALQNYQARVAGIENSDALPISVLAILDYIEQGS